MARTTDNGEYPYPEQDWAVGRMRKRGDQYAMMQKRKGEPEFGGADIERAAGMGLQARGASTARSEVTRGAGGLSPDVIQQQKSQIQALSQQWQLGTVRWSKVQK